MLYGLEYWPVDRKIEQRISVSKIRILKWMNGVTKGDRIRDAYIRDRG